MWSIRQSIYIVRGVLRAFMAKVVLCYMGTHKSIKYTIFYMHACVCHRNWRENGFFSLCKTNHIYYLRTKTLWDMP